MPEIPASPSGKGEATPAMVPALPVENLRALCRMAMLGMSTYLDGRGLMIRDLEVRLAGEAVWQIAGACDIACPQDDDLRDAA